MKKIVSIFLIFILILPNFKYCLAYTKCDTTGNRCIEFSWANCHASFSNEDGNHTKYVYCNKCSGLVLVQKSYSSCVSTNSTSYQCNNDGTHKLIVSHECIGDSKDGSKWGGCGVIHKDETTESCIYETKIVNNKIVTYCKVCGYIKSSENLDSSSIGDSLSQGSSNIYNYTKGLTISGAYDISMWHYSGHYWYIGDFQNSNVKVDDVDVGTILNINNYLDNHYGLIVFSLPLPTEVKKAYQSQTSSISIDSTASNGMTILNTCIQDDSLLVSVSCTYKLNSKRTLDDYVSGLNIKMPIIEKPYGYNLYAIYKNGVNQGAGRGLFESATKITSPYIHPSEIANKSGALKSGYSILVNEVARSSDNCTVGWNTFSNGGAVGLEFYFPFTISFSIQKSDSSETGSSTKTSDTTNTNTPPSGSDPTTPPGNTDPVNPPHETPSGNQDESGNSGSSNGSNEGSGSNKTEENTKNEENRNNSGYEVNIHRKQ